ncbi:DUF1223 domain-containing protein [Vibrio tubiashii]|uniref:DUF1223 domain-containing protein n=1 Tax=Vibrio tubiashii TaxID=29498 RepID=UPI001EFD16A1|nr:DUF1223 domain-containing protein [Vibrio tubiashii]MCG9580769.1 DUF1223 domain-containing protein [Vibrio tubiashii]MCG9614360.1 DUF1223 domain-containing protein [Vibrio tubiashii]
MTALIALSVVSTVSAGQIWVNEGQPAQVVELFTSEGCSSCPPADKYISKFESNSGLWDELIPVVYHVDYWDYLGWKDKFAKPEFSQLQRLYNAYDVVGSVYTPGFVVDGKEWRGFFNWVNRKLPENEQTAAKRLTLVRKDNAFQLKYDDDSTLDATIIFLSNNQTTQIRAGENRGKTLEHDFIAVSRSQARSSEGHWTFTYEGNLSDIDAVAAWITPVGSFNRIQTVAGKIE